MAVRKSRKYDASDGSALQLGMFEVPSDWTALAVSQLPSWANAKRVAIDVETYDPHLTTLGPGCRREGYAVGWSFAIDGGPSYYLPYRHEGGGNLPAQEVIAYLGEQCAKFDGEIVGANLNYDIDWAATDGIIFNSDAVFRDVQVADPLIYELHQSFSLKNIGERWGVEAKDEELLERAAHQAGVHPKKGLWRLHAKYVGGYAERDVTSPLEILRRQEEKIEGLGLRQIWEVESRVLPVLVKMRQRGVLIDTDRLSQIAAWSLTEQMKELRKITDATSVKIGLGDLFKADAVAPALEAIGIKVGRTPKTGLPNIDASFLEGIDHPVPAAIRRARKLDKIRTTFVASIERYMINGRIHCTFNQIAREDEKGEQKGVRFGRLSAVDPNLQQQPSKDRDPDVAGMWRQIYVAEPDSVWGCCDYSQQEPRWTTHFAAVLDLPRAKEAAQRYVNDPDADNHDMMTRLVHGDEAVDAMEKGDYKVKRAACKNIFLGICYGEGGPKLCRDLGLPTRWRLTVGWGREKESYYFETRGEAWNARQDLGKGSFREVAGVEGQAVLDGFDENVPYVRKLARAASDRAESVGFVRTVLGRRLHFATREDGSYDWTHKALNRVIQGSSADQMKLALIEIDKAGHYLQLQVHDEANASCQDPKEVLRMAEIMRDCILPYAKPLVPFKVDAEYGPNWGNLKNA